MQPVVTAAIGLGANLGDREATLLAAVAAIAALGETRLLATSSLHNTAPVGPVAQGDFLNGAAAVATTLGARQLLARLHDIERAFGRDRAREERWGPRTLDLDLLLYGDERIAENGIEIPHPRMTQRLFVLAPLAEILPAARIAGFGTVSEALAALRRTLPPE